MTTNFKKTEKQKEAIGVLNSNKYAALYGGARSGKTFIIVYAIVVRAAKIKSRHAIIRKTFNAVKRSIWMDTLPKVLSICFPSLSIHLNKTDYILTLSNGSEIFLAGMDDSNRAEKILGMEFSTLYFNEASELDYSTIQIAISRLAEKNILTKRIFFDFNPPAKTHWSYWVFIKLLDPSDDGPLSSPETYGHLLMNPSDNLDNIDSEYLKILEKMPKVERERFLEGKFSDQTDGLAYYAFDRDRHVKEVKYNGGTIFIGMDFNVMPMTAVVYSVYNNAINVFDEVFLENSDTYKMVDELLKRKYSGMVIPDSTGKNRKTSGQSDFDILEISGFRIPAVYNPAQADRVNNVNRLLTDDRLLIDKKCKKLINDLSKVSWKDNKLDQKGTNKMLTHISDALGYGCWHTFPINGNRRRQIQISKR